MDEIGRNSGDAERQKFEWSIKYCREMLQSINTARQIRTVNQLIQHNDAVIKQKNCIIKTAERELKIDANFCLTCPECVRERRQLLSSRRLLDDDDKDCGYSTESEPNVEKCETFV